MKKLGTVFFGIFFLLFFSFELSHAKAILKIICDVNGGKVYVDGKFKAECYEGEPVEIIVPAGKHTIVVKKFNKDGSYYYFKRRLTVYDGTRVTITANSQLKYTEKYYYNKAKKSQDIKDYVEYLEKYPKGKYVKQAKAKLKKVGYPIKVWEKTFGGKGSDKAKYIVETSDGNYLIAGWTNSFGAGSRDVWVIKLDKNGNKIWEKTFGGKYADEAKSIIETSDGNYVIAGYTASYGAGNGDAWVIKIDKNGNKIWDKTFGGSSDRDGVDSIIETKDGGYIVAGYTRSFGNGYHDVWVIKLDKDGNKLWDSTYGSINLEAAYSIIETKDGNYIIAGFIEPFELGSYNVLVIKIDKNGKKVWHKIFGGKHTDEAYSIIETSDGNYVVAGYTDSFGAGGVDVWIIKIDKNGNKLWDKTFGGKESEVANFIIETKDGNYIIAGYTFSLDSGNKDVWVIKIDKDGNKLWDKTIGGKYRDEAKSIIETSDGNYIIAGFTESFGAGYTDIWVIKLKPMR